MTGTTDRWLHWLQEGRSGGDAALKALQAAQLAPVRERVLKQARIVPGDTVLDVGCGDGLIGFGALDLVGQDGRVVFSDISRAALDHCESAATEMEVADRCSFVECAADSLSGISDASVDVVTTRSVLIYVEDKAAAFRTFHRVLRPGGRISLFEPINSFERAPGAHLLWGIDVTEVAALADRVRAVYERATPADSPMLNFDERDLIEHARAAGFPNVKLQLDLEVAARLPVIPQGISWDALIRVAPNPLAPSLFDAMREAFDDEERAQLEAHLRQRFEAGEMLRRSASAYLQATN